MLKNTYTYQEFLFEAFPQISNKQIVEITFQVTEDCNLRCSYCYQINKSKKNLSFEDAKIFIDEIFARRKEPDFFANEEKVAGFVIDFIGGEPLLQIDLIDQIIEYFENKLIECDNKEWLYFHCYHFSSNGTLYFSPKFQEIRKKYGYLIHTSITVDGCKEFHDSCRLFPDGTGSYDIALKAALNEKFENANTSTKLTVSPDNIPYIFQGIKNMINMGFRCVHINCCFEDIWNKQSAIDLFNQLKLLADWIKENDLNDQIFITFFDAKNYTKVEEAELKKTWCGASSGNMISINPSGYYYPCIRFMESSLGDDVEPITFGNVKTGILNTEKDKHNLEMLSKAVRENISQKECLECSIASGCSWCIGYCYQYYQSFDKKTTFICDCYKMQALACKYFYKIMNEKHNFDKIDLFYDMYKNLIDEKTFNDINNWEV